MTKECHRSVQGQGLGTHPPGRRSEGSAVLCAEAGTILDVWLEGLLRRHLEVVILEAGAVRDVQREGFVLWQLDGGIVYAEARAILDAHLVSMAMRT